MRIVVFGLPGCGKTTFSDMLAETLQSTRLSTPDFNYDKGIEPDKIASDLFKCIEENSLQDNYVVDGYISNVREAEEFDKLSKVEKAVFLSLPYAKSISRLIGRRVDPQTKTIYHIFNTKIESDEIRNRLCLLSCDKDVDFVSLVTSKMPQIALLEKYYEARGVLLRVDANRAPGSIKDEVIQKIGG